MDMKSIVVWFEIPAQDLARCQKFYETIMDLKMQESEVNGHKMAFFPHEGEAVGGAIIEDSSMKPGVDGPIVYLNGGSNLQEVLEKIEPAGGKIIQAKTLIDEKIGDMALFEDTEGNRLALYNPPTK